MAVNIIEVCHVSPPQETAATRLSIPLTFFDLFWLKHAPVQRIFFYRATQNLEEETLFSQLKQSLTVTLQHFPVFAGHLTWPDTCPTPVVRYENGNFVALTLARSDSEFCHLIGSDPRLLDESLPLVPVFSKESSSRIPIIALQITVFKKGELCIGITTHHGFMDGNSSTAFLKTWASCSKFGENREPILCFDRNDRFSNLDDSYCNTWLKYVDKIRDDLTPWEIVPPPGKMIGTFELNGSRIKKLKDILIRKGVSQVSSFTVAYAYTLVCFVKTKKVETEKVLAKIHANYRSRLAPPLPLSYVGNCVVIYPAILDTKDVLGDEGFFLAARAIREGTGRCMSMGIEGANTWLTSKFEWKNESIYTVVSSAGSNRFGFYGIDFGWGRPERVETTSIGGSGTISFADGKDGSGVEIALVLYKDEMENFSAMFEEGLSRIQYHA